MYKSLEYAYPSSPTAIKKGYANTGCWFIRFYPSPDFVKPYREIGHSNDKEAVVRHYDSLPQQSHKFSQR